MFDPPGSMLRQAVKTRSEGEGRPASIASQEARREKEAGGNRGALPQGEVCHHEVPRERRLLAAHSLSSLSNASFASATAPAFAGCLAPLSSSSVAEELARHLLDLSIAVVSNPEYNLSQILDCSSGSLQ